MRTIKFRGKRMLSDDWEYGNLIQRPDGANFIETGDLRICPVQDFTVGQFTGLLDKNGNEIYEGDIVRMSTERFGDEIFQIGYEDSHIGAFVLCEDDIYSRFVSVFGVNYGYEPFYCEVIGNMHDNPELLKNND